MNNQTKFSPEVRERAVRIVQEQRGEYPSLWAAVESMAPKFGCVPATLLGWNDFKRRKPLITMIVGPFLMYKWVQL